MKTTCINSSCWFAPAVVVLGGILPPSQSLAQWQVINLHPPGAMGSRAFSTTETHQCGYTVAFNNGIVHHAAMWQGSAGTYASLHAGAGYLMSEAFGTALSGATHEQVGVYDLSKAALWLSTPAYTELGGTEAFATDGSQRVGYQMFGGPHAYLWTGSPSGVDLTPLPTFPYAIAFGVRDQQQCGSVSLTNSSPLQYACIWNGGAASYFSIHPVGATTSNALSTNGFEQVGCVDCLILQPGSGTAGRAAKWQGTPASYVDLHPSGAFSSIAWSNSLDKQVGTVHDGGARATMWIGSAASRVDLHALIPPSEHMIESEALGVWTNGTKIVICGYGYDSVDQRYEALLWTCESGCVTVSCYADCDGNGVLDIDDFLCFQTLFALGDPYADCDGNGELNIDDFLCFQTYFAIGC